MRAVLLMIFCLLVAGIAQADDVTFKWAASDPADKVASYNLYQDGVLIRAIPPPATTITIKNVSPEAHTYYMTAANSRGESGKGTILTLDALPRPITGLVITTTTVTTTVTTATTIQ